MLQAVQKTLVNYSPGYPSPPISLHQKAAIVRKTAAARMTAKKNAPQGRFFIGQWIH